jgi:hypothetical protein
MTSVAEFLALVDAEADKVAGIQTGRSGAKSKYELIAAALKAVARNGDFNQKGVYRQRDTTSILVTGLGSNQVNSLHGSLRDLRLQTVEVTKYQGSHPSVTVTVKHPTDIPATT